MLSKLVKSQFRIVAKATSKNQTFSIIPRYISTPSMIPTQSFTSQMIIKRNFGELKKVDDESASSELAAILVDEIAAESAEVEEDTDLIEVTNIIQQKYKISEQPFSGIHLLLILMRILHIFYIGVVQLTREISANEKVVISFNVQNRDEVEPDFNENEEIPEDEDYEGSSGETGVSFTLEYQKNGTTLMIDAMAASKLEIRSIMMIPKDKSIENDELYNGPIFDDLDDKLKDAIEAYVEELGVDADMVYFILAYSQKKEQEEYERWLKSLLAFTGK